MRSWIRSISVVRTSWLDIGSGDACARMTEIPADDAVKFFAMDSVCYSKIVSSGMDEEEEEIPLIEQK